MTRFWREGSGDTFWSSILAPGVAVGYRAPVMPHFAVRLQANYRRWIDPEWNELSTVLIVALVGS